MRTATIELEVTESGDVFFHGKKVSHRRSTRGYGDVRLPLHRVIATAFHGPPPTPSHVCHHIDSNPRNNSASNLAWITQKENCRLASVPRKNKLTPKQIKDILEMKPTGPTSTLMDLARSFGISKATAYKVRGGHTWKNGWFKHNAGVLTQAQIDSIRAWTPRVITAKSVARKYHISDATVLNIWHGRHYFSEYHQRTHG